MKNLIFSALIYSGTLVGAEFSGCGEYQFKGHLIQNKKNKSEFQFIVNGQTKSQMIFSFSDPSESHKLVPLLEKPVTFRGFILEQMDGTKGRLSAVTAIDKWVANPLSNEAGLQLIEKKSCK